MFLTGVGVQELAVSLAAVRVEHVTAAASIVSLFLIAVAVHRRVTQGASRVSPGRAWWAMVLSIMPLSILPLTGVVSRPSRVWVVSIVAS